MPAVPDRWVILRVRFSGPFVVVRVKDSDGEESRAFWEGPFAWPAHVLAPIASRVQLLANTLPAGRFGPHNTGPVPLALFVDVPRFVWSDPSRVDRFLAPLNAAIDPNRVQVVGLSGKLRRPRALFTLPFRVAAHGPAALAALLEVGQAPWTHARAVRERGFAIHTELYSDGEMLERALRAVAHDVLITDQTHVAVDVSNALPLEQRPRLIVSIDSSGAFSPPKMPPSGTALVAFGSFGPAVKSMLYGLVHDLPIHEAARATVRTNPVVAPSTRVFADRFTNQSLRIRDALVALQTEAEQLDLSLPRANLSDFLLRVLPTVTDESTRQFEAVRGRLEAAHEKPSAESVSMADRSVDELVAIRGDVATLRSLPDQFEHFERESDGLVPMADASAKLSNLTERIAEHTAALATAMRDPDLAAILEKHQERVVDIALQRLDTNPVLSSLDGATTLEAGAVYRMRIHIGNPSPDSLIIGPQAPIDPLLPDPDAAGHLLEVVVQGKDFEVIDDRTQPLHLPRFGGSRPVYFAVRAPRASGAAALRVHVYYQNHLVLSYLLEAQVTSQEEVRRVTSDVLRVSLAYTRLERLVALDRTRPRLLSIGVNNGGGGTHNFIVKGTSGAGELTLPALAYQSDTDSFHQELERASRDPKNPRRGRVYTTAAAGAPAPPQAATVLREFIHRGASLYRSLKKKAITSNPNVAKAIDELKTSRNQKVQVVRLDPQFVFPWTLLYDFRLPPQSNAPVCLGTRIGPGGQPESCGHSFDSGEYCVYGFWSVRHYVEEMINHVHPMIGPVSKPVRHGVRLVCDDALAGVPDLHTALSSSIGAPDVIQGPATEAALLDLLWAKPTQRPAILVVLGHMAAHKQPGNIDSPRIVLQAGQWLTQENIDDKLDATPWDQPRPVVLLMACDAAAMTATTVNSFVGSFHAAGAAAVIGAEAVVASDLAAAFARDLTKALWNSQPLGEAMTRFRRTTLAAGNPLAFLFHGIGDIDLTIQ